MIENRKTEAEFERYLVSHPAAGAGPDTARGTMLARGIFERVDDYRAAAFVYCREPQAVRRLDIESTLKDIEIGRAHV